MKNFKEYITEIFDKPYPFELTFDGGKNKQKEYQFVRDNGVRMFVGLVPEGTYMEIKPGVIQPNSDVNTWELVFGVDGSNGNFDLTGDGDAFKVFATVAAIMKLFIKKNRPPIFWFSSKYDEDSRKRLYGVLLKKAKIPGYKPFKTEDNKYGNVVFGLFSTKSKILRFQDQKDWKNLLDQVYSG